MEIYQVFVYLQLLDLLTTLVGLRIGTAEASPFVRLMMHAGPTLGVVISKVLALGLGGVCVYLKRPRLVLWATYWFAGLVVWNLMIMLKALEA